MSRLSLASISQRNLVIMAAVKHRNMPLIADFILSKNFFGEVKFEENKKQIEVIDDDIKDGEISSEHSLSECSDTE